MVITMILSDFLTSVKKVWKDFNAQSGIRSEIWLIFHRSPETRMSSAPDT